MSIPYRTGTAFRTAIEARLKTLVNGDSAMIQRLRKEIAIDRLLARLVVVAPDRWVLKGGVALDHRLSNRARSTQDLDLGRRDNLDEATTDVQAAARLDLGDYMSYTVLLSEEELSTLRDEGVAARFRAECLLGGRIFERISIDIDHGHALAAQFLNPVLTGSCAVGARWNPATLSWQ